jgi:hypothetical protein
MSARFTVKENLSSLNFFLKEMVKIDNIQDAEIFMLKHGENIVDRVGAEIDRIERNLRVYKNLLKKFLNN